MSVTSKTGLLPSVRKNLRTDTQPMAHLDTATLAVRAPYVLRPFAGVYNPFPYGCSILCNHPADYEAKNVVKKAKNNWATEGKALLTTEEYEAAKFRQEEQFRRKTSGGRQNEINEDSVPEELFRKYTDTDSRPLTPAPTVASMITKASQARRCVTPDPIPSLPNRERTLLVLDLRRSHSQETISWQNQGGENAAHVPPGILASCARNSVRVNAPVLNQNLLASKKKRLPKRKSTPIPSSTPTSGTKTASPTTDDVDDVDASQKLQHQVLSSVKGLTIPADSSVETSKNVSADNIGGNEGDTAEIVKRRGKKRRGKKMGRDGVKEGEKEFQGIPDPGETQVSALGNESRAGSNRPSLTPGAIIGENGNDPQLPNTDSIKGNFRSTKESFLDTEILKQLQRQLDQEVVDSELDVKRKLALEEAMRYRPTTKQLHHGEEMKMLKKELQLPTNNPEKWLTIPRVFTRQSARFELPMDSRELNVMTPLQYAQNFVFASGERLVLYNHVFNLHREEFDDEYEETERILLGKNVLLALGEIMGRQLSEREGKEFRELMGWTNDMKLDFRTFAGVAAVCERTLAPLFCSSMPTHQKDPRHEIEQADFESLDRKLLHVEPDRRIIHILKNIRDF